jgi:hypothetical protein
MIAFLLDITRLDPIKYGLMFERFLNPYRKSPPDIDCDFPGDNHDMMLDFVAQRYGRDKTAQVLTFTKFKIKSAIDKICKALMKKDDKTGKIIEYGPKVAEEVKKVLEITGDQGKMPDQSDCTYQKMMDISVNPQDYEGYGAATLVKFVEASKEFRKMMTKYPELNLTPAAAIMTRVVSHPGEGIFTLDLGYKGISADPVGSRGVLLSVPDTQVLFQSEEHWTFQMKKGFESERPQIGSVQYVIPTHICPTVALYAYANVAENGYVLDKWEIAARNRCILV